MTALGFRLFSSFFFLFNFFSWIWFVIIKNTTEHLSVSMYSKAVYFRYFSTIFFRLENVSIKSICAMANMPVYAVFLSFIFFCLFRPFSIAPLYLCLSILWRILYYEIQVIWSFSNMCKEMYVCSSFYLTAFRHENER